MPSLTCQATMESVGLSVSYCILLGCDAATDDLTFVKSVHSTKIVIVFSLTCRRKPTKSQEVAIGGYTAKRNWCPSMDPKQTANSLCAPPPFFYLLHSNQYSTPLSHGCCRHVVDHLPNPLIIWLSHNIVSFAVKAPGRSF